MFVQCDDMPGARSPELMRRGALHAFVPPLLVLVTLGGGLRAQPSDARAHPRRPDVEVCEAAVDEAMAVQSPSLRGDLLLKAVRLCPESDKAQREKVLEAVLQAASQVERRYPFDPVPIGFTDTEPALASIASKLGVDQLSLRARAIAELGAFEPGKVRDWFEPLRPPTIESVSCGDFKVARLIGYYELLREIVARSFSQREVADGTRDAFISSHLFPISSPAHLMGAVYFLAEADLSQKSLANLLASLASQLDSVDADDRAFTVQLLDEGIRNRFRVLAARCKEVDVPPGSFFLACTRYYARHLSKPRCADVYQSKPLHEREEKALGQLTGLARIYSEEAGAELSGIRPEKLLQGRPPRDLVAATPQYGVWLQGLMDRRKQEAGREPAEAIFTRITTEIDDWKKPKDFTEREFFQIRALVLVRLMQQAATKREKSAAVDANGRFFGTADEMQRQFGAEWLSLFREFLAVSRGDMDSRDAVIQALESNRDLAVSAYARMTRIAERIPVSGGHR